MAYKAKDRNDLLSGIDEFLDQVTVLPPGEWDPSIRIEPPKSVPSQVGPDLCLQSPGCELKKNPLTSFDLVSLQEKRKMPSVPNGSAHISDTLKESEHCHPGPELQRTGRWVKSFKGLCYCSPSQK